MDSNSKKKLKILGIIFLNFAIFYAILRLIILFAERTGIMAIYYIGSSLYVLGAAGAFIAYFCLNGYTLNREDRSAEELPEKWTEEKKKEFLDKQPERKKKARSLLYILMPIIITLFINYIELTFIK